MSFSNLERIRELGEHLDTLFLKLSSMESDVEKIFETVSDGILVIDREGTIVLANHCIEEMFGYSRDELIGKPMKFLVPDRLRKRHEEGVRGFFNFPGKYLGVTHVWGLCRDGTELPLAITITHMTKQDEILGLAFVRRGVASPHEHT